MSKVTTQQLLNDSSPWAQHTYCVVDYEGTGLQYKDAERVVELAAIRICDGQIAVDRFSELVDPEIPIPRMATRVHGIHDSMVRGCPTFAEISPRFESYLGDSILVAHNARVEQRMLERLLPTYEPALIIDTLKLSRSTYEGETKHSLQTIVDRLDLSSKVDSCGHGVGFHRAEYDAVATALVFLHLVEVAGRGTVLSTSRLAQLANIKESVSQQALF